MTKLQSQIDRLVDGELSHDERCELLQELDREPSRWRDCALSFVESKSLRAALANSTTRCEAIVEPTKTRAARGQQKPSLDRWLALAASLAIAFAAGLHWQGTPQPTDSPSLLAGNADPSPGVDAATPAPEFSLGDENTLVVWTVDRDGQRRSLHVPLVEADWVDRQLASQFPASVNEQFVQQLRDNGYELQSRRRYAPLMFGNSEPYLLPVDDNQIVQVLPPLN